MIRTPFSRKPRSPLDQALEILEGVRAEAAQAAGTVRDAASKAADTLGEAAPDATSKRLPLIGAGVAVGAGIAVAVRSRLKGDSAPVGAQPVPTATLTARDRP